MRSFEYRITDEVGLHARPAGLLVKEAKKYASVIRVEKDGKSAEAGRLMALMGLGIKKGDLVTVTAEGNDEEAAAEGMEKFFKDNL